MKLCQIIVQCFCPENGTILDPFMGGGNLGVIANRNKRNYIGIEINQRSFSLAEKKLITSQNELF